jgi:hypothetical protein
MLRFRTAARGFKIKINKKGVQKNKINEKKWRGVVARGSESGANYGGETKWKTHTHTHTRTYR